MEQLIALSKQLTHTEQRPRKSSGCQAKAVDRQGPTTAEHLKANYRMHNVLLHLLTQQVQSFRAMTYALSLNSLETDHQRREKTKDVGNIDECRRGRPVKPRKSSSEVCPDPDDDPRISRSRSGSRPQSRASNSTEQSQDGALSTAVKCSQLKKVIGDMARYLYSVTNKSLFPLEK